MPMQLTILYHPDPCSSTQGPHACMHPCCCAPGPCRLLMHAVLAQGMSISQLPDGRVEYEGSLARRRKRLTIAATILLLRTLWWLRSTCTAFWVNMHARASREPVLVL